MRDSGTKVSAFAQSSFDCTARTHWWRAGGIARTNTDTTTSAREGTWAERRTAGGTETVVTDRLAPSADEGWPPEMWPDMWAAVGDLPPAACRSEAISAVRAGTAEIAALLEQYCPPGMEAWITCTAAYRDTAVLTPAAAVLRGAQVRGYLMVEVAHPETAPLHRVRESYFSTEPLHRMPAGAAARLVDRAVERAVVVQGAGAPPDGVFPVVMGPQAASTFVHEVCHLLEEDALALPDPPLGRLIGERVAGPQVSVVDRADVDHQWAGAAFDDEGTPAGITTMIDEGALVQGLRAGGSSSTGNGRRMSHRHRVLARMSQTALEPGTTDPADLIGSVDRGLLISHLSWGKVNQQTGAFELLARQGRVIRGGRLAEPFVGGAITGDAVTALGAIDGVGTDVTWVPGMCIKLAQELPGSTSAPTALLSAAQVRSR
jgi:hypothetical protein